MDKNSFKIYISSTGDIGQDFSYHLKKDLSSYKMFEVVESYEFNDIYKTKDILSSHDVTLFIICSQYGDINESFNRSKQEFEYDVIEEIDLPKYVYIISDNYKIPIKSFEHKVDRLKKFNEFKIKIRNIEIERLFNNHDDLCSKVLDDLSEYLKSQGYNILNKQLIQNSEYKIYSSLESNQRIIDYSIEDGSITQLSIEGKYKSPEININIFTGLSNLRSLKFIDISLKVDKNILKFNSLDTLTLSKLNLTELPKELFTLEKLKKLDVSDNLLKEIPIEIINLKNLIYLNYSGNKLATCPRWIWQLKNLETLNLSKNFIKSIPETLYNLKKLRVIFISKNRIKSLPIILSERKELQFEDLRQMGLEEFFRNDMKHLIFNYMKVYFNFLISLRSISENDLKEKLDDLIKNYFHDYNIDLIYNEMYQKDVYDVFIELYSELYDFIHYLIKKEDFYILQMNCSNLLPKSIEIREIKFSRIEILDNSRLNNDKNTKKEDIEDEKLLKSDSEDITTILHLSDLHIGKNETNLHHFNIVFDDMIKTVKRHFNYKWKPNIVLVTGDLAWNALDDEYEILEDYFLRICNELKIEQENIIICSGNHDVNQNSVYTNSLKYPADPIEADMRLSYNHLINNNDIKPFDNFIKFCNKLNLTKKEIINKGNSWLNHLTGQTLKLNTNLITLNSAWFSYEYTYQTKYASKNAAFKYIEDKGRLWIGKPLLDCLYSNNQIKPTNNSKMVTISIMHHPSFYLNDLETFGYIGTPRLVTFDRIIECSNIILCGHIHNNVITVPDCLHCKTLYFKAGTFFEGINNTNTFSIYKIDLQNRFLQRKAFKWNVHTNHWEADISNYRRDKWNILF